jgi:transcriptional regulator with XRE-family HTH domain
MAEPVGRRIRAARLKYGMTGAELARRVGITPQNLNVIERGNTDPRASHVAAIARVLRVSTDYLLGLTDKDDVSESLEVCSVV